MQSILATFPKNRFHTTFGGHLEFPRKAQKCIYLRNGARYSDFDKIFNPQGICRVYWRHPPKIAFLLLLATILNFCLKHKSVSISETVRDRVILTKFSTHRVYVVYWRLSPKITFPPFLAAILNFCVKHKSAFILETVRDSDFDEIFYPQGIVMGYWRLFAKITFRPHLATILNFCLKRKSASISETVRMTYKDHRITRGTRNRMKTSEIHRGRPNIETY